MPPSTTVWPSFTSTCVTISRVSMLGTKPPVALATSWPTLSFATVRSRMTRLSGVICGVTFRLSTAFLNGRGRAAGRGFLVRNFHALLDRRFALVRSDQSRRGDDLAAAFGLRSRQLQVDDVVGIEQRQRQAAGRIGDRQIDHVALDRRPAARSRAANRLRRPSVTRQHDTVVRGARSRWRADDAATVAAAVIERCGRAEAHAELAAEVVVDDHDARFDQHLPHRNVERRDQPADVGQALRGVLQQQRVGALVDRDAAALREQRVVLAGLDQRREVARLRVVDLQVFGAQRRQLLHFLARGRAVPSRARRFRRRAR